MFLPTPDEIRRQRNELSLTQSELAKLAGVSQPLIARIETGDVDPRLSTLKKIFKAFEISKKERITVKEIMHTPVIHTHPEDEIKEAVRIMEEHGISQLPVLEDGIPVGSISSDNVIHHMTEGKITAETPVREVMGETFPTVSPDTDTNTTSHMLEKNPAILILHKGKVTGLVTKHDVMRLLKS